MKMMFFLIALLCSVVYGENREQLIKNEIAKLQQELKLLESATNSPAVSLPEILVNVLFIDEFGNVPDCYKGVRVSDIKRNNTQTSFPFDGKTVIWNKKAIFSYQYTKSDVPIVGTIYHPVNAKSIASKVINVAPYNVYQDTDGTIRYDNLNGNFPLAPKGSGYVITNILPPQQ